MPKLIGSRFRVQSSRVTTNWNCPKYWSKSGIPAITYWVERETTMKPVSHWCELFEVFPTQNVVNPEPLNLGYGKSVYHAIINVW